MNIQSDLKKLLAGSRKAATSVSEGLQELRLRRLRLLDERDDLAARPVPKDQALAALDRDLDDLIATAKRETNVRSLTRAENPAWTIPQNGILIALLISTNREAFRAQLAEMIAPAYADAKPIEAAEREAALRRIDDEVIDIELAEEAAIRGAEAAGLSILRRADADPRAVLLADEELI